LSSRSIGKTVPGHEVELDERGEILVRGENVSPGYWGGGLRSITDEEGWLRTGDVGELDEQGNLYFKSRKKDVIVTAAGLNIYPDDLEAVLRHQPEIRDCAVINFAGDNGDEPLAVLILETKSQDVETVLARANSQLSPYQQMR